MSSRRSDFELRILVVAPTGRDAGLICEVLAAEGIASVACASIEELGNEVERGAGAILIAAEALAREGTASLERVLQLQEPWSEIPIILVGETGRTRNPEFPIGRLDRAGAVTILERPVLLVTLRTVAQAMLRARRRQYELRDVLAELQSNVARLDTERVVRERFVSVLAHDLRGPLSAASMTVQLVLNHPEHAASRPELALRIQRNLQRMDRMIRDLLDANRIRAGERLPLDVQRCDLVEIVSDAMSVLDDAARSRVRVSAPDRLEGMWAPDQLHRAVWNLVQNALKYGLPAAPVDVSLSSSRDGDAEFVTVAVHNEGPSIPPDEQQRIFQPFGRGRAETRARGWGLGLTLVRGCAEAHGGAVVLTSTPETGTTFALRLPRVAHPA